MATRRPQIAILILLNAAFMVPLLCRPLAAVPIPPPPEGHNFVADYAKLLRRNDIGQLATIQRTAFEEHGVPIMVVTITSMGTYGAGPIEKLAARWFDTWRIGTMDRDGGNRGMLLLVSTGDRRARIELGADWGHAWDDHAKEIMDYVIIPEFKNGNSAAGIVAGVRSLAEMATCDPFADPPDRSFTEVLTRRKPLTGFSPIPGGIGMLMVIAGGVLIVLGIMKPGHRKLLVGLGAGLIVAALFLWVVVGIAALFLRGRGFGSSGGFSGGFSGGGGASGSW